MLTEKGEKEKLVFGESGGHCCFLLLEIGIYPWSLPIRLAFELMHVINGL